jgi:hypothetical protein
MDVYLEWVDVTVHAAWYALDVVGGRILVRAEGECWAAWVVVYGGWWYFSGRQVPWWWWLVGLSASMSEGVQLGENHVSVLHRTSDDGGCGCR